MTPAHVRGQGGRVFQHALAQLLVAEGRYDDALAALDAVPAGIATTNPVWNPRGGIAAMALQGLGRTDEALAAAEHEVALLRRWGAPSYLGRGLCLLGELMGHDGIDALRESVALLTSTSATVDLAHARYALGRRHQVEDGEAVPLLLAAGETAAHRGAPALHEAVCEELRRRGHPVSPRQEAARPLSPTERQVLELSNAGVSVEDVARRLFLTPDTVRAVLDTADGHSAAATTAQVSLK